MSQFLAADGRTFGMECDQIEVTPWMERAPSWRYTDPAGHRHSYGDAGTYVWVVTDRWINDDGDEDEEGEYRCVQCGAVVRPGMQSPMTRSFIPGLRHFLLDGEEVDPDTFAAAYLAATGVTLNLRR